MFKLQVSAKARKELKQISRIYEKTAIIEAIDDIKEDPLLGKPLNREFFGMFSYKVGVYRIVYKITEQDKKIIVLRIRHRSTVYR